MALGSNHLPIEMSTGNLPGSKGWLACKADKQEPRWASMACCRDRILPAVAKAPSIQDLFHMQIYEEYRKMEEVGNTHDHRIKQGNTLEDVCKISESTILIHEQRDWLKLWKP
jgi:hypothetical protein